jgi:hypothetical protein
MEGFCGKNPPGGEVAPPRSPSSPPGALGEGSTRIIAQGAGVVKVAWQRAQMIECYQCVAGYPAAGLLVYLLFIGFACGGLNATRYPKEQSDNTPKWPNQ